eukprot:1049953-Pyramimonas_sp.AAC.1
MCGPPKTEETTYHETIEKAGPTSQPPPRPRPADGRGRRAASRHARGPPESSGGSVTRYTRQARQGRPRGTRWEEARNMWN